MGAPGTRFAFRPGVHARVRTEEGVKRMQTGVSSPIMPSWFCFSLIVCVCVNVFMKLSGRTCLYSASVWGSVFRHIIQGVNTI